MYTHVCVDVEKNLLQLHFIYNVFSLQMNVYGGYKKRHINSSCEECVAV